MTGINSISVGKLTHTLCSVDGGNPANVHLGRIVDKSIANLLFFKHQKLVKSLTKRQLRPKYLLSGVRFNKKYFFKRNKS